MFVDVIYRICGGENFGLVYKIYSDSFKNLSFGKMANSNLGHYRDADSSLDALYYERIAHPGNSSILSYVCRDTFQRHYGDGASILGYSCLFDANHVHDDAVTKHVCQSGF